MATAVETRKIFINDPVHFKSMVNTVVEVETVHDSLTLKGILYTIDPVSEAVVLITSTGSSLKLDLINGYNVKSIKSVNAKNVAQIPENLFKVEWAKFMSEEKVEEKRAKLKEWLLKNSIPIVETDKVLKLDDILTIGAPYGPDNVMSNNEIVLDKIQGLIKSMPE